VSLVAPEAALLSAVLAASPVGAAIVAPDLTLLEVNQAFGDLLGYAQQELLGTSLWDLRWPDQATSRLNGREPTPVDVQELFDREHRFRRRDGRVIWTRVTGSILPMQGDGSPSFLIFVQELAEPRGAAGELLESQIHARQVLDSITDGIYSLDRNWRITYCNTTAAKRLGNALQGPLGRNIWDVFPPAVETTFYTACQAAVRDGVPVSVETFYPPTRSWFEAHVYPSADGLTVVSRNITEAKELELSLRTSDAHHRFLLDHVPAVIYALANDAEQTRLYFSPRHVDLTGYTLAETLSQPGHWLDLVHPDDRPRTAAENHRSEAAGDRFRAEYRLRRKDGTYVWVLDECVPVRDDNGQIISWQGVLLDITDRITAQAAQGHLAALVMSAEDAIISSDLDGLITSWNPGATRLYGYRAEEILGRPFERLLPASVDRQALAARIRAARSGATVELFETQRQRQDGTVVDVAITMSPIRDENGKVIGVSTITRDITERNRVERALRDALEAAETAARTKSLFLAMMSHELRTPVQAVLGYADLLLLDPAVSLTPDQLADVTYIRNGARRLDKLIDQLLDLSRLEAGRLVLDVKAVALADVVGDVRQDIATQAKAKHLALQIDVPDSLPLALGDPDRLRQIVLNLAENAVKFTDEGSISIRGREVGNRLAIEVSDTGIGIAPDALPTIFEEFRQVDSNLTRRHGGAGLGLAIAERLATQMHGTLRVSSEVGQGSTFVLEIPRFPD
jgi:PAS domain S-box-containing protein